MDDSRGSADLLPHADPARMWCVPELPPRGWHRRGRDTEEALDATSVWRTDRACRVSATNTSDMRLAIYCRTSTHNGGGTDSLGAQTEACRAWATERGHEIVAVHRDQALSGALGIED